MSNDNYQFHTEENAKTVIDERLRKTGWDLILDVEKEVTISRNPHKRTDYLLKFERGKKIDVTKLNDSKEDNFIALIEAKKLGEDLDLALEQGKAYANILNVKYVFASDGEKIRFLNLLTGKRKDLDRFYTRDELIQMINLEDKERNTYKGLPEGLRPYQKAAINAVIKLMKEGTQKKAFLEMATGTGKTYTAATLIEDLIHKKIIKRALFLVDRDTLSKQTFESFKSTFQGRIPVGVVTGTGNDKANKVLVSTVQKMYSDGKQEDGTYQPLWNREDFDLIILDECHRSYYGEWHMVLDYFEKSVKLGLTATPARMRDRDTYDYFGDPIHRFSYYEAILQGYLCQSEIYRITTNIDLEGFNYDGEDFGRSDLERKVNVYNRNKLIVDSYRERFPQPKKTIVFAVSQKHASQLAEIFRDEYGEDAVAIIVSDQGSAINEDLIEKYRDPHSMLKIVCTVDMLATGFDAPCTEVLVMARPTKSRVLYYQMKGRGSRLFEGKTTCTILDFVDNVNHEYADEIITGDIIDNEEKEDYERNNGGSDSGIVTGDIDDVIDGKTKFVVADGVEVWIEQEEFLGENEQKLKEILSDIHKQTENLLNEKEIESLKRAFRTAVISWETIHEEMGIEKFGYPTSNFLLKSDIFIYDIQRIYGNMEADMEELVCWIMGREYNTNSKIINKFNDWLNSEGFTNEQSLFLNFTFNALLNKDISKPIDILQSNIVNQFGGIQGVLNLFGGIDKFKNTIDKINKEPIK